MAKEFDPQGYRGSDPHRVHEPLHIARDARDRQHALKIAGKGTSPASIRVTPPSQLIANNTLAGDIVAIKVKRAILEKFYCLPHVLGQHVEPFFRVYGFSISISDK